MMGPASFIGRTGIRKDTDRSKTGKTTARRKEGRAGRNPCHHIYQICGKRNERAVLGGNGWKKSCR